MTFTREEVAAVAKVLSDKARAFISSIGIASWWRTEEGERVPQSLLRRELVERDKVGGIDFAQYRLTSLGLAVRDYLRGEQL